MNKTMRRILRPMLTVLAPIMGWLWLRFIQVFSRVELIGSEHLHALDAAEQGFIIAFWHNRQIILPIVPLRTTLHCLISSSGDGEYVAGMTELFGKKTIRGSSSKGGLLAMKTMMKVLRAGDAVAVSPDGPRGPAFQVKPGIIQMAQNLNVPILPFTFDNSRKKVLSSWDKFYLPRPFGRLRIAIGEPLSIDKTANLDDACEQLRVALNDIGERCAKDID